MGCRGKQCQHGGTQGEYQQPVRGGREMGGAPKQEQIKVSVTHWERVVTGQFLLDINIKKINI